MSAMTLTKVRWINHQGEFRQHSLYPCTPSYARNWWRESILECQGVLSVNEKRESKLKFLGAVDCIAA